MKLNTLPNCIISGIETACYKLCKTCSETSHCGNPNACTSCYPGDNKISEEIDDQFFQCSKECDVTRIRLDDGSYFCPSSMESTTENLIAETSDTSTYIPKLSTNVDSFISLSSTDTTWIVAIIVIIFGITVIIIMGFSKKNAKKAVVSRDQLQQIKITNKQPSLQPPSSSKWKPLIPRPLYSESNLPLTTNTNLEVIMNNTDFEKGGNLGGGKYSRGTLRGEPVAIKVALKEGKKNIYKEQQIYEKLEHPSIVKALGVHYSIENMIFLKKGKCDLATYFVDYGSLKSFQQLKQYCIQIADGMKYLHEKEILHCDLKIDNILVKDDEGEYVEISDFGSAIDQYDIEKKYNGTVTHTAYELLKKILYPYYIAQPSKPSDVWSYAITAWQIFQKTSKLPADFIKMEEIVKNYEQGRRLPFPAFASEKFWKYIFYPCFDLDPESRPTMANLHKMLTYFREDPSIASTFTI